MLATPIPPFHLVRARDILHLRGRVPYERVTRHTIAANSVVRDFPVVIGTPYVGGVIPDGYCDIDELYHTEVDTRFQLHLTNPLPIGHRVNVAYRTRYSFPEGHTSRECRGFAARSLEKAQIYVVFDPAHLPARAYGVVWEGPSDGTVSYESIIPVGPTDAFDTEQNRMVRLEHAALVDMPAVAGTTFGIRWEW